jgi:hypothetical protein
MDRRMIFGFYDIGSAFYSGGDDWFRESGTTSGGQFGQWAFRKDDTK